MYAVPQSDADAAKVSSACLLTLLLQRSGIVRDFDSFDVEAVAPSNSSSNFSPTFSATLKQKIFKTVSLLLAGISTVRVIRAAFKLLVQLPGRFFSL